MTTRASTRIPNLDSALLRSALEEFPLSITDYDAVELNGAPVANFHGLPARGPYFVPSLGPLEGRQESDTQASQSARYESVDNMLYERYDSLLEMHRLVLLQRAEVDALCETDSAIGGRDLARTHAANLETLLRQSENIGVSLNVNMLLNMLDFVEMMQHMHFNHILRAGYNHSIGALYRYKVEEATELSRVYSAYLDSQGKKDAKHSTDVCVNIPTSSAVFNNPLAPSKR